MCGEFWRGYLKVIDQREELVRVGHLVLYMYWV